MEKEIPYYVIGTGGRDLNPVPKATGAKTVYHNFDASLSGYGYLTVKASANQLSIEFIPVDNNGPITLEDTSKEIDLIPPTIK